MKDLCPEHAKVVADKEKYQKDGGRGWWDITPYQQRLEYFREIIKRYGAVGAFPIDEPSRPVAWLLRKTGTYDNIRCRKSDLSSFAHLRMCS